MKQAELEALLLLEVHRVIERAARKATTKFGQSVPPAARDGYITAEDIAALRGASLADFDNPLVRKEMEATVARNKVLSYPPNGTITERDATALASLKLSEDQRSVGQCPDRC
jgi:hypothetical protein